MSLSNFIPQVWSGTMLRYLDKTLVFAQPGVVNRDYEGDIAGMGDTVMINQVGPITIGDYTRDTDIGSPETLTSAQTTLVIDQAKFFNFQVDDIDQAQQNPKVMETAMQRAAYAIAEVVDEFAAGVITAGVDAGNDLGTVADLGTATNAYLHLVALSVALDEANVPTEGRWAIIPPWYHGLLLQDDRFVKSGSPQGDASLLSGQVGEAAGFRILKSNNVVNATGDWDLVAGVDAAASFAQQVVDVIAYQPEKRFADAVKGLNVYGAKVVLPTALAKITATKP
jgi:N4-gp56 family major capsid protein